MVDNQALAQAKSEVERIYQESRERAKAAVDEARKHVREAFGQGAQRILDEIGADSFSWVQFTPYWNDGDTCYFGVYTDFYYLEIDGENGEEYYISRFDNEPPSPEKQAMNDKFITVQKFVNSFDEDDLQFMFDDHVRVTVTRDGVETEEYSHD